MMKAYSSFASALCATGSLMAAPAFAGDAVISSTTTGPITSSNADGAGPGNITISSTGEVTLTTSGAVIVLDSNNAVINSGIVRNSAESGATGILASTSTTDGAALFLNSSIIDNGTITITGPASTSSSASIAAYNTGIKLDGSGLFIGSIQRGTAASMTVGGDSSVGIGVSSAISGAIINAGKITTPGTSAFGITTSGAVGGAIVNEGLITAAGKDGTGIYAGAGVAGGIINRGEIVTGALGTTDSVGKSTDGVAGGHALWLAGDSGAMVMARGSSLTSFGGSEAIYLGQGGAGGTRAITIGTLTDDSGLSTSLLIEGSVTSRSAMVGSLTRALTLVGTVSNGVTYATTLTGMIHNTASGSILASAVDGIANAVHIGAQSVLPGFVNAGTLTARTIDSSESTATGVAGSGGGDAYAVILDTGANMASFVNSGTLTAQSRGASQSAYGVLDNSGTLISVINQGTWAASVNGSGVAVALDLSTTTKAVTFVNSGAMTGSMKFGSGADNVSSSTGTLTGNITLGAGDDTLSLRATTLTGSVDAGTGANIVSLVGSAMTGGLTSSGTTSLAVSSSTLTIPGTSAVQVTDARFSNNSSITFQVDSRVSGGGTLKASGTIEITPDTVLKTQFTGPVTTEQTFNLIEATTLSMTNDLSALQPTSSSIMYEQRVKFSDSATNILQLDVRRRTAAELGLDATASAIYDAVVPALASDEDMLEKFVGFATRDELADAVEALEPHVNDAVRSAALTTQYLAQGAIRRRLNGLTRREDTLMGREYASTWAQVFGTTAKRSAATVADAFKLTSGGLSAGFDGKWTRNAKAGVSISETYSNAETKSATDDPLKAYTTSLNVYLRHSNQYTFTDVIAGLGLSKYRTGRSVTVDDITRDAKSSWSGYQWGTAVDTGLQYVDDATRVKAYVRGAYLQVREEDYVETGGGDAVNLAFEPRDTRSLRAGGGVSVEQLFSLTMESSLSLEARGDYAHEFKTDPASIRARFAATVDSSSAFTIQGISPGQNVYSGGAGLTFRRRASAFSLDYDMERSDGYVAHTIAATYRMRF